MRTLSFIILLLIAALLVQNTCPRGFTGKSSVAASCSHCPQKQPHTPITEGDKLGITSDAAAHLPMYVLDLPNTQPAFRLIAMASPLSSTPNIYKNTDPDRLLHPPRA